MSKNNSLRDEWKDTVYDLGGAFVGLGKTIFRSLKTGVDYAYDRLNEADSARTAPSSRREKAEPAAKVKSEPAAETVTKVKAEPAAESATESATETVVKDTATEE